LTHFPPSEERITFVADRPAHDRRYALDCRKITRELGWRPRTSFDDGLAKTVRWYLENDEWIAEVTEGRYDFSRLGLSA
jgi:dTDP-glucose 4,6-dehydratase